MPRLIPSDSLSATIRAHFGLTQTELGRYLGVRREQVALVEAGQRRFSRAAEQRLLPLALLLPGARTNEPPVTHTAEADAPAAAPETAALRKRLRRCQHQISELRWALENQETRAQALAHRQRGLAQLRAGLLPDAAAAAALLPAEAARTLSWLDQLAADTPPAPAPAVAPGLQVARLRGLVAEAQSLEELLVVTANVTR